LSIFDDRLPVAQQRAKDMADLKATLARERVAFYVDCAGRFARWGNQDAADRFRGRARAIASQAGVDVPK